MMTISVATWNLWWRFGDWEARSEAIAHVLRTEAPDVIALQEVWHTPEANQAQQLARAMGYQYVFAPGTASHRWRRRLDADDGVTEIGNAVLSRWPIERVATVRLPPGDAPDEGRIATLAVIASPAGSLPVCCVHLNSGWGQSTIRKHQLSAAARLLAEGVGPTGFPPVLAGDFNADADFDEVRALAGRSDALVPELPMLDLWALLRPEEAGWTWDRRNPAVAASGEPSARIDYLFAGLAGAGQAGEPMSVRLIGTEPVGGVWPSDHAGVLAELATGCGEPSITRR